LRQCVNGYFFKTVREHERTPLHDGYMEGREHRAGFAAWACWQNPKESDFVVKSLKRCSIVPRWRETMELAR
jgi:hypothetical protein